MLDKSLDEKDVLGLADEEVGLATTSGRNVKVLGRFNGTRGGEPSCLARSHARGLDPLIVIVGHEAVKDVALCSPDTRALKGLVEGCNLRS